MMTLPPVDMPVRFNGTSLSASSKSDGLRLRRQLLIPFVLVIALLISGALWFLHSIEHKHIQEESLRLPEMLQNLMDRELEGRSALHKQLIEILQGDARVRDAWLAQDRAKMLGAVEWSMRLFKADGITHLYFIKPDRECFLRVHRPAEFGDRLDRASLVKAVQEGTIVSGVELGVFHSLSLRTIVPWLMNNELVGYVELSTDLRELISSVQKTVPARTFFLLSKSFLRRDAWEAEMRRMGFTPDWDLDTGVALMQDATGQEKDLLRQYFTKNNALLSVVIDQKKKQYQANGLPVFDFRKQPVGTLLLLDDWTERLASFKWIRIITVSLSTLIFLLLGGVSYVFLGRIERELVKARRRMVEEASIREKVGRQLAEKEQYLKSISDTIDGGILVVEAATRKITDVNRAAAQMLGCPQESLIGRDCHDFMCMHDAGLCNQPEPCLKKQSRDQIMMTPKGESVHMRRTYSEIKVNNAKYVVQSLSDITDLKNLLAEKDLNIALARRILNIINPRPRHIDISDEAALFVNYLYTPCRSEGGDHFFMRTIPATEDGQIKTVFSLKDQSGHEVNCILRSIATDLIHNRILMESPGSSLERVTTALNKELCKTECFSGDDFLTALNAEIDHQSMTLSYVSAGHPGFMLIRDGEVIVLPQLGGAGSNLPLAATPAANYSEGRMDLKKGDKLICYTDGLTEMPLQWGGNSFSRQDMSQTVRSILQQRPRMTVRELCSSLLHEVSGGRFSNYLALQDDVSMVGIEIEDCLAASHHEVLHFSSVEQVDEAVARLSSRLLTDWKEHGMHIAEWRLQTVLEESLRNAWRHGNREDPAKSIVVRWKCHNDAELEVIDEGPGFDSQKIPNPTEPDRIMSETGRGIFMIQRCVDSLRWKDEGRHLIVSFSGTEPDIRKQLRLPAVLVQ